MAFNNEIEEVKAQLKVLEKKLALLEELEKTKSPVEEAYKDWWGVYPGTEIWTNFDETRWVGFKAGYNAAYEQKVSEEPEVREWDVVRESMNWHKKHPDKDPLDWVKPQTPEQVADGLKEAFREAVKQGIIHEVDKVSDVFMNEMVEKLKGQTLYDVIADWWERVFGDTDDTETCIDDLVDRIEAFLPKPQSTAGSQNAYVESAVEGFNDAIKQIKSKLR
jgi:hypothetical protein